MTEDYAKLVRYVNAAIDLAEAIEKDIKGKRVVSTNTVLKLSEFAVAARNIQTMLDFVERERLKSH